MRRPPITAAQRQHAREQRALLRLRRAAVGFQFAMDSDADDNAESRERLIDLQTFAGANLEAAAVAFSSVLSNRERRRLAK